MNEEFKVNDGKGFLNNDGLIDSMIIDLNTSMKSLVSGQYIAFCDTIRCIAQKLDNLKKGVKAELADRDQKIKELRKLNDDLAEQVYQVPVERNGEENE